jgi:hypothetical protein
MYVLFEDKKMLVLFFRLSQLLLKSVDSRFRGNDKG